MQMNAHGRRRTSIPKLVQDSPIGVGQRDNSVSSTDTGGVPRCQSAGGDAMRATSPSSIAETETFEASAKQTAANLSAYAPAPRVVDMERIKQLAVEVVPGRLYFTSLSYHPTSTAKCRFFTVDYDLAYEPYFADFGPLNLGMLIRFCRALRSHIANSQESEIIFYSSHSPHLRANAGYLIAGFAVLVLGMTTADAIALMDTAYPPLLPFRDASYGVASFQLTVADTICALHKARALGWIDVDAFNVEDYEKCDSLACGDMNWIVPGKLLAFSSPVDSIPRRDARSVIPALRARGVRMIIRLNEKLYDRRAFTEVGLRHEELEFPDGSTPPDAIVRQFLEWCESQPGAIAVHCKAGLGRTGTLAGVFVMKHFAFSAREFIAWARVCRPGSVIGSQQQYLEVMQRRLDAAGETYRRAAAAAHPASSAASAAGLSASASTARPSTVQSQRSTAAATTVRPTSPPTRLRPKPLVLAETLPFEVPGVAAKQRIERLQRAVAEDLGGAAAAQSPLDFKQRQADGDADDATRAAAQHGKLLSKTATSTSGISRPLLPLVPSTIVGSRANPATASDPQVRLLLQSVC